MVLRSFQDGATPETIVQRYPTLELADAYTVIAYYLNHQPQGSVQSEWMGRVVHLPL